PTPPHHPDQSRSRTGSSPSQPHTTPIGTRPRRPTGGVGCAGEAEVGAVGPHTQASTTPKKPSPRPHQTATHKTGRGTPTPHTPHAHTSPERGLRWRPEGASGACDGTLLVVATKRESWASTATSVASFFV